MLIFHQSLMVAKGKKWLGKAGSWHDRQSLAGPHLLLIITVVKELRKIIIYKCQIFLRAS
jgi:hypothetical protein